MADKKIKKRVTNSDGTKVKIYYEDGTSTIISNSEYTNNPNKYIVGASTTSTRTSSSKKSNNSKIDVPDAQKKFMKWDSRQGKYRINIPEGTSYEEKQDLDKFLTDNKLFGKVVQSRTTGTGGNRFYGGLGPKDFEEKFATLHFGKEAAAEMGEQEKRNAYFKYLGLDDSYQNKGTEIYNDDQFNKEYYAGFKKKLPAGEYRESLGDDSKFGFEHYDALVAPEFDVEKVTETTKPTEDKTAPCGEGYILNPRTGECIKPELVDDPNKPEDDWWLQDKVNYIGALTDKPFEGRPIQGKVQAKKPGYVLEDPTRQLAASQESMAKFADLAENTGSAQNALSAFLAASGQGVKSAADIIGNVQNRNVQTVNRALSEDARIGNQEALLNEKYRKQYHDESMDFGQNLADARSEDKWREIAAFNQGTTNYQKKRLMEDVLFPQAHIDPNTGEMMGSGKYRDATAFGASTYYPAYANGAKQTNFPDSEAYGAEFNAAVESMGEEGAKEYMKSKYSKGNRREPVASGRADQIMEYLNRESSKGFAKFGGESFGTFLNGGIFE